MLIMAFIFWVGRQERLGRPALIKNSLWRDKAFTSICISVFLIWGAFNAFEQMLNYFFQNVQNLSALETAWRFLPTPLSGSLSSIVTGLVLHRVRADWIINITTVASSVSPFLMALVDPRWSYWVCGFPAIFLNSIGADSLFTVSNIVIASVFPPETQGLAGGVFNTVSQIGKSVGLALVALIANSVTENSSLEDKESSEALMEGYRAAFWFLFALSVISLAVSIWGLRKVGHVGRGKEH
jgi:nitrate/nitrite transporter NarK